MPLFLFMLWKISLPGGRLAEEKKSCFLMEGLRRLECLPEANPILKEQFTMKRAAILVAMSVVGALAGGVALAADAGKVAPAPNGIAFPADYPNWRVISVSHRTDKNSMRAILGNDIAIEAARTGKTLPWPDGAILAKVAWKEGQEAAWPTAIGPKEFAQVEFMVKDAKKWADTGGWGYARWVGSDLKPYGKDKNFAAECLACHTPVKSRDWVYTTPASMPFMPSLTSDK